MAGPGPFGGSAGWRVCTAAAPLGGGTGRAVVTGAAAGFAVGDPPFAGGNSIDGRPGELTDGALGEETVICTTVGFAGMLLDRESGAGGALTGANPLIDVCGSVAGFPGLPCRVTTERADPGTVENYTEGGRVLLGARPVTLVCGLGTIATSPSRIGGTVFVLYTGFCPSSAIADIKSVPSLGSAV